MIKARKWIVIAALVVAGYAGIWWFFRPPPEPSYQDKTLTEWMVYSFEARANEGKALQAIRSMGEPALQYLIRMAETDDAAIKRQLLKLSERVPLLEGTMTSTFWYRLFALKTLAALGPDAKAAIPTLVKLSQDPDRDLSRAAGAALLSVRQEPLEPLIKAYFSHDGTNYRRAFAYLLELGPRAKQMVPDLLNALQSTNSREQTSTLTLLGRVGVDSPECVSPLTNMLASPSPATRQAALEALSYFGPLVKPALPAVTRALEDPDPVVRSSALIVIMQAVPTEEFAPLREPVQHATNDPDATVSALAETILRRNPPLKSSP